MSSWRSGKTDGPDAVRILSLPRGGRYALLLTKALKALSDLHVLILKEDKINKLLKENSTFFLLFEEQNKRDGVAHVQNLLKDLI